MDESTDVAAYFRSDECQDMLEEAYVSDSLVLKWQQEKLAPPSAPLAPQIQTMHKFYRDFVFTNADRTTPSAALDNAYRFWSKCCHMLDAVIAALERKQPALLEDPALVAVVALALAHKQEDQATGRLPELLASRVPQVLEQCLGIEVRERTLKQANSVEWQIMQAMGWAMPAVDTHMCVEVLIARAGIVSQGRFPEHLAHVHQAAQQMLEQVLCGVLPWDTVPGYALAVRLVVAAGSGAQVPLPSKLAFEACLALAAPLP